MPKINISLHKWILEMKNKKYAPSTLRRKISQSPKEIKDFFNEGTLIQKVNHLKKIFQNIHEKDQNFKFVNGLHLPLNVRLIDHDRRIYMLKKNSLYNDRFEIRILGDSPYAESSIVEVKSITEINFLFYSKGLRPINNLFFQCNYISKNHTFPRVVRSYKMNNGTHSWSGGYVSFSAYRSPTSNCQLFSISGMYSILAMSKEEIFAQLREVYNKGFKKPILLCDIKENISKKLIDTLPSRIISNTPYKSTSGSDMTIILINLKNI